MTPPLKGGQNWSTNYTQMRPLLLLALLCVPPNIAAFGLNNRPSLGARSLSPQRAALGVSPQRAFPTVPRRGILRLEADDDTSAEADVGPEVGLEQMMKLICDQLSNFRYRILDPLNAKSSLTGLSFFQSTEMAFVAGQKVACNDGLVAVGMGVGMGVAFAGLCAAFAIITVAPTVSTWMKSVLWAGAAVWAAWMQQK